MTPRPSSQTSGASAVDSGIVLWCRFSAASEFVGVRAVEVQSSDVGAMWMKKKGAIGYVESAYAVLCEVDAVLRGPLATISTNLEQMRYAELGFTLLYASASDYSDYSLPRHLTPSRHLLISSPSRLLRTPGHAHSLFHPSTPTPTQLPLIAGSPPGCRRGAPHRAPASCLMPVFRAVLCSTPALLRLHTRRDRTASP
jgi:hypothetical protein